MHRDDLFLEFVRVVERAAIAAMKPGVPVNEIFDVAMRTTREHGMPRRIRRAQLRLSPVCSPICSSTPRPGSPARNRTLPRQRDPRCRAFQDNTQCMKKV